jgi:hypothetical protein
VHPVVVQAAVSIEQSYEALTTVVVVLPPPGSVVEVVDVVVLVVVVVVPPVGTVVVVVVELGTVELVVVLESVVVGPAHGQLRVAGWPTTNRRQTRASVAVVGRAPLGAQMHSGSQVVRPTTTRRMYRQSVAVGVGPFVAG